LGSAFGGAVLVPLCLRFKHAVDQFLVVQQAVRLDHPRLPQRPDIFVDHAFPQHPLSLFASCHALLCRHSETTSIVNVPAPNRRPDSLPVRLRTTSFATESSYAEHWRDRALRAATLELPRLVGKSLILRKIHGRPPRRSIGCDLRSGPGTGLRV